MESMNPGPDKDRLQMLKDAAWMIELCREIPAWLRRECEVLRSYLADVYLMREASGACKIGYSRNPKNRRCLIAKALGREVELLKQYPSILAEHLEHAVHQHFAVQRLQGEWFDLSSQDITDFLNTLACLETAVLDAEWSRLQSYIGDLESHLADNQPSCPTPPEPCPAPA